MLNQSSRKAIRRPRPFRRRAIVQAEVQRHAAESFAEPEPSKSRVMSFEKPNGIAHLLLDAAIRSADVDIESRCTALDGSAGNARLAFAMNDDRTKSRSFDEHLDLRRG